MFLAIGLKRWVGEMLSVSGVATYFKWESLNNMEITKTLGKQILACTCSRCVPWACPRLQKMSKRAVLKEFWGKVKSVKLVPKNSRQINTPEVDSWLEYLTK